MTSRHEKSTVQDPRVAALLEVIVSAAEVVRDLERKAEGCGEPAFAARARVVEGYLLRAIAEHGEVHDGC